MSASHGDDAGHSWCFRLGGRPLSPSAIREAVRASGYRGFRAEAIDAADALPEPKRTRALRALREQERAELRADLARYRQVVLKLHQRRAPGDLAPEEPYWSDTDQAVALKHNHLWNGFAHLIAIEERLFVQGDLFG